jgi:hypothetical protein
MTNERRQVLELLSQGKVSAEEAEQLLERVEASGGSRTSGGAAAGAAIGSPATSGSPGTPKFMCVHVDTHEGDEVKVRLPLALVKSGIKLSAMLPKEAAEAMSKNGVDFSQLSTLGGADLVDALRDMQIDVSSHEGDQVKIYCE